MDSNNATKLDSFGVKHILKEIEKFIINKSITTNIYRIQAYDAMICRYFCIGFINFMFHGKSLTIFVSATRRIRDIKIQLCLLASVQRRLK